MSIFEDLIPWQNSLTNFMKRPKEAIFLRMTVSQLIISMLKNIIVAKFWVLKYTVTITNVCNGDKGIKHSSKGYPIEMLKLHSLLYNTKNYIHVIWLP